MTPEEVGRECPGRFTDDLQVMQDPDLQHFILAKGRASKAPAFRAFQRFARRVDNLNLPAPASSGSGS